MTGRLPKGLGNLARVLGAEENHCIRIYSRNGGVNEVEVAVEGSGDRVAHRPDGLLSGFRVRVHSEVSIEQLVGLADRHGDGEPVSSCGCGCRSQASLLQPGIDGFLAFGSRCYEFLNLATDINQQYSLFDDITYLLLAEMFAVGRAVGSADGVKRVDQSLGVVLHQCDAELHLLVGVGGTSPDVASGGGLPELVDLHVPGHRLRNGEGDERREDEELGDHLAGER